MSLAHCIVCCALALLGTFPVHAREPAERLLDEQRQAAERSRLERDALPPADAPAPALNVRPDSVVEDGVVIEQPSIAIDAAGLLPARVLASLTDEFSAVPLGVRRITLLLRRLDALLVEAGWTYRDGALRNAKGEPFTIEVLNDQPSSLRVMAPMQGTLRKLGIEMSFRSVDFSLAQQRMAAPCST